MNRHYTIQQAAEIVGVTRQAIYQAIGYKHLKSTCLGTPHTLHVILHDELMRYIKARKNRESTIHLTTG